MIDAEKVISKATQAAFGKPVINNVFRAIIAETVVACSLPEEWAWCSGDWAPCDFKHCDGTRLEVKQSAARQSWHSAGDAPSKGVFDIAIRKGFYDGTEWNEAEGRNADIYVFAFHPVADDTADQRDPAQWHFYVVPTSQLPATKRIGLPAVARLASPVGCLDLAHTVEKLRGAL